MYIQKNTEEYVNVYDCTDTNIYTSTSAPDIYSITVSISNQFHIALIFKLQFPFENELLFRNRMFK